MRVTTMTTLVIDQDAPLGMREAREQLTALHAEWADLTIGFENDNAQIDYLNTTVDRLLVIADILAGNTPS